MKLTADILTLIKKSELEFDGYNRRSCFDAGDDSQLHLSNQFLLQAILKILIQDQESHA